MCPSQSWPLRGMGCGLTFIVSPQHPARLVPAWPCMRVRTGCRGGGAAASRPASPSLCYPAHHPPLRRSPYFRQGRGCWRIWDWGVSGPASPQAGRATPTGSDCLVSKLGIESRDLRNWLTGLWALASPKVQIPRVGEGAENSGRVSIYNLGAEFLPLGETFVFALKALPDWMRPIHII